MDTILALPLSLGPIALRDIICHATHIMTLYSHRTIGRAYTTVLRAVCRRLQR